jgi:hypothetical protein
MSPAAIPGPAETAVRRRAHTPVIRTVKGAGAPLLA